MATEYTCKLTHRYSDRLRDLAKQAIVERQFPFPSLTLCYSLSKSCVYWHFP
ncbi:hypothetical protein SCLCIDRAFT_1216336 [Scleroderma citrinum Foug A]|uniref:Uncharacterized protein n=1 Tax=Scleroderma citrinum Foug A TaxID=1036808 RepID=A0A0C2ZH90_9AGAM|nr:hypothetical protein SCLCIDRAFT_1216336 [Scleroderma citrinum Foug A]